MIKQSYLQSAIQQFPYSFTVLKMTNNVQCCTEVHSGALFLGTLQHRVYCCHSTLQRDIFPLSFQWAVNLTKRLQRATEWFYVLFRNYLLHFAVGPSLYYIVPIFFPFRLVKPSLPYTLLQTQSF